MEFRTISPDQSWVDKLLEKRIPISKGEEPALNEDRHLFGIGDRFDQNITTTANCNE